jgi:hypothetical protein
MPAMLDRRRFFGTIGLSWILFHGRIGRVVFCRASSPEWLRTAREICLEPPLIAEVDPAGVPAGSGAVFLGSKATLVVGHGEWRVLP